MLSCEQKIGSLCLMVLVLGGCVDGTVDSEETIEVTYFLIVDPSVDDACKQTVTEHRPAEHWREWVEECGSDMSLVYPTTDGSCVVLPHICDGPTLEDLSPFSDPWFDTCDNNPLCCDQNLGSLPHCVP